MFNFCIFNPAAEIAEMMIIRDRQWTDLQGGSREGVNLGRSSGSTDNPTSNKNSIFESFRP